MLSWHTTSRASNANSKRNAVLARLSPTQVQANTTRGSTPGLIDPALGPASARVPVPTPRRGQGVPRAPRQAVANHSSSESDTEDAEEESEEELEGEDEEYDEEDGEQSDEEETAESSDTDGSNELEEDNSSDADDEMSSASDSTETFIATPLPMMPTNNEDGGEGYWLDEENFHSAAPTHGLFTLDTPDRESLGHPPRQFGNNNFEQPMDYLTSIAPDQFWGSLDKTVAAPHTPHIDPSVVDRVRL